MFPFVSMTVRGFIDASIFLPKTEDDFIVFGTYVALSQIHFFRIDFWTNKICL